MGIFNTAIRHKRGKKVVKISEHLLPNEQLLTRNLDNYKTKL